MLRTPGPLARTIAIAPRPGGVAIAAIVVGSKTFAVRVAYAGRGITTTRRSGSAPLDSVATNGLSASAM